MSKKKLKLIFEIQNRNIIQLFGIDSATYPDWGFLIDQEISTIIDTVTGKFLADERPSILELKVTLVGLFSKLISLLLDNGVPSSVMYTCLRKNFFDNDGVYRSKKHVVRKVVLTHKNSRFIRYGFPLCPKVSGIYLRDIAGNAYCYNAGMLILAIKSWGECWSSIGLPMSAIWGSYIALDALENFRCEHALKGIAYTNSWVDDQGCIKPDYLIAFELLKKLEAKHSSFEMLCDAFPKRLADAYRPVYSG